MMQFTKATAHQSRLRLALIGPAGSGKTYTALSVAQHLGQRIAVIDTERGSASKYASLFGFDVLELTSFAPQTYVQAIQAADAAGYDVLVIDSLSHAWMGKDGALEMKDAATARDPRHDSFGAWRQVTPAHNQMVDAILQSTAHVIVTMRTKTEYVIEQDASGKNRPRKVGMAPVQRDGLEYEFDLVGDLDQEHTMVVTKSRCSGVADAVIKKPGKELAETLRTWLGQGEPVRVAPAPPEPAPPVMNGHEKPQAETRECAVCHHQTPCYDDGEAWLCMDAATCKANEQAIVREPIQTVTLGGIDPTLEADLDAAFREQAPPAAPTDYGFGDGTLAERAHRFAERCAAEPPHGLALPMDQVKRALGGTLRDYMKATGRSLDAVYAVLKAKVEDNIAVPDKLSAVAVTE